MKKKLAVLTAVAMMAASLFGCSPTAETASEKAEADASSEATQDATAAAEASGAFEGVKEGQKLLFFAIQNIGDYGINDLGYYAAQDIAEKYKLDLTLVEGTADPSVRTTSLLDALETGGYDYCITASWYILDDLLATVDTLPDTKFIIYDTNPTLDLSPYKNCYGISFRQDEGSFLTAVYQCLMTKTGKVGAVAGQDAPILNDFVTGWIDGVKWYNDNMGGNIEYNVAYLSDQTVQGDYETASVVFGANCDIVYNICGSYCLGALKACTEAGGIENGKYLVGVDYDQYQVFSESDTDVEGYQNLVTSMEKKIRDSIVSGFDAIAEGGAEMLNHRVGLANGGVGLAYNQNYKDKTPEDVQKQVSEIEQKIKDGEIKVQSYFDFPDYDQFKVFRDDPSARIEK